MNLSLEGFPQLDRRFNALGAVAQRSVLSKALKKKAEMIRDEARRLAPQGATGNLKRGITFKQEGKQTNPTEAVTQVGTGKDEFYGYFVQFGTGLTFDRAAARALGYPGMHVSTKPTNKPTYFLTAAIKATEGPAMAAVEGTLEREITKAENA